MYIRKMTIADIRGWQPLTFALLSKHYLDWAPFVLAMLVIDGASAVVGHYAPAGWIPAFLILLFLSALICAVMAIWTQRIYGDFDNGLTQESTRGALVWGGAQALAGVFLIVVFFAILFALVMTFGAPSEPKAKEETDLLAILLNDGLVTSTLLIYLGFGIMTSHIVAKSGIEPVAAAQIDTLATDPDAKMLVIGCVFGWGLAGSILLGDWVVVLTMPYVFTLGYIATMEIIYGRKIERPEKATKLAPVGAAMLLLLALPAGAQTGKVTSVVDGDTFYVNTPPADAGGFSDKLCGIPLAWRPKASSWPLCRPLKDDHCRGNVAVDVTSAVADVASLRQPLGADRPAIGARLTCAAWIDQNNAPTGTFRLVGRELDELAPRGIVNGPGQYSTLEPGEVKVFEGDQSVPGHKGPGLLVSEVAALVRDLGRRRSKTGLGLATSCAASFAAGKSPLMATHSLRGLASKARRRNRFALAGRDQAIQPQIDTNRGRFRGSGCGRLMFDLEADEPLTSLSGKDRVPEPCFRGYLPMPNDLDLTGDADDTQSPRLSDRQPISHTHVDAVEPVPGPESREPPTALEESGEGLVDATQNLLQRGEAPAGEIGICLANRFQFSGLIAVTQGDAAPPVSIDALFQTCVVERATVPKHRIKGDHLRLAGPKPVLEGADHQLPALLRFDVLANGGLADRPHRSNEVRSGPKRRQTGPKVRKLLAKNAGRVRLHSPCDLSGRPARVALDEEMHMIRHHFEGEDSQVQPSGDVVKQFL
jgi:endonuclease YncB( thermonuclease family)